MADANEIKEERLAVVAGISKALEYKALNPRAEMEDVLQHAMRTIKAKGDAKLAAIAAATRAIKYRDKFPKEPGKKIMQLVLDKMDEIVAEIREDKK